MKKFLLALIVLAAQLTSAQNGLVKKYPDVLNIKNIPGAAKDLNSFAFLDKGAWFGFALPPEEYKEFKGSLCGPYSASAGCWLGRSFLKFSLLNPQTGAEIDLKNAKYLDNSFYPGRLVQKLQLENTIITLEQIFISGRTAVVKASLSTDSKNKLQYKIRWSGTAFAKTFNSIKQAKAGNKFWLTCMFENDYNNLTFHFDDKPLGTKIITSDYMVDLRDVYTVEKNKPAVFYIFITQADDAELFSELKLKDAFLKEPDKYFKDNNERWNGYLSKIFNTKESWKNNEEYKKGAIKSLETIIGNWKIPMGSLKHEGVVPSYSHDYFTGFWAWDSWKHAAALANFEPEIAMNQIRAMFDFQDSRGMIADCVFIDSTGNNWLDSKPPLAAWAAVSVYNATKDKNFLMEIYPKLVKYHNWWYSDRDHDKNGLCEYGSTKDSLVAAMWESGMDNAIRFDGAKMVKNDDHAYSMNLESVDLNSYLYAEKLYLAEIASLIGSRSDAETYKKDALLLKEKIQKIFFDNKTGWFFDCRLDNKDLINVFGPEGWLPLWAGAASKEQAAKVKNIIMDKNKFNTHVPFPTVSIDNEKLDLRGYWRGPVWLDQAYFGIEGLKKYGYEKEAAQLTEKLFNNLSGYLKSGKPIRENYDPKTGEGLKANNFSWSAAHLLLLWLGK